MVYAVKSDPIRRFRHDFGGQSHEMLDRPGQFSGPRVNSILAVFFLFIAHLLDDGPALEVLGRQVVEMTVEMRANLPFRLGDEPEAPFVTQDAAHGADRKGARVPEWTQFADVLAKFVDALLAPGEVIELLIGRPLHLLFD